MKFKILIALAIVLVPAVSCQEDDFDREFDSTHPVSGEWYVQEYYNDGTAYGPYHVQIFNTSFSKDSLWVNNIYDSGVKVKALLNADDTFGVTQGRILLKRWLPFLFQMEKYFRQIVFTLML